MTEFHRLTRAEVDFLCAAYDRGSALPFRYFADTLSIFPAAAARLAQALAGQGYVRIEGYGACSLSEAGVRLAAYHVRRRSVTAAFAGWLMGEAVERAVCDRFCETLSDAAIDAMEARLLEWAGTEGSAASGTCPRIDFRKS